jgi:hypothetical protein
MGCNTRYGRDRGGDGRPPAFQSEGVKFRMKGCTTGRPAPTRGYALMPRLPPRQVIERLRRGATASPQRPGPEPHKAAGHQPFEAVTHPEFEPSFDRGAYTARFAAFMPDASLSLVSTAMRLMASRRGGATTILEARHGARLA